MVSLSREAMKVIKEDNKNIRARLEKLEQIAGLKLKEDERKDIPIGFDWN